MKMEEKTRFTNCTVIIKTTHHKGTGYVDCS